MAAMLGAKVASNVKCSFDDDERPSKEPLGIGSW
jgi:hypothetical protein